MGAKKIVVVLGMHRSGTSAIARGLSALGVDLGDSLMPGVAGNNDKGFFEDVDIAAFNDSLLRKLDSSWDDLKFIVSVELLGEKFEAERCEARRLFAKKITGHSVFGFKDPRVSILLPFWKSVFSSLSLDVSYVVCLRNPLSVARSLHRRDGMSMEKGVFLWLKYTAAALIECDSRCFAVVDYDQLFFETKDKLIGLAALLNLPINKDEQESINLFVEDFFTTSLRHNVDSVDELNSSSIVPDVAKKIYAHLALAALSFDRVDSDQVHDLLSRLHGVLPIFNAYQHLDDERNALFWRLNELQQRISAKESELYQVKQDVTAAVESVERVNSLLLAGGQREQALRDELSASHEECKMLGDAVLERGDQISKLLMALSEDDKNRAAIAERDRQIEKLLCAIKEEVNARADIEVVLSRQAMLAAENDRVNAKLSEALLAKESLSNELHLAWHEIERLKYLYAQLEFYIGSILGSWSWMVTKPFRFLRRNLLTKPLRWIKGFSLRVMRAVWRLLPVSSHLRIATKNFLFGAAPVIFRKTEAYAQWDFSRKASALSCSVVNSDLSAPAQAPRSAVDQGSVGEIPRIAFDKTEDVFVERKQNLEINPLVKVIAFYLPQFHPFPENDLWWGKGFTEWTNVGKAKPNYEGHYQPHCPIHLGYYDLRVPQVMEEQARLAREYGVYGFNYYFYWFAGKILMDTPLEAMLQNKNVDMPFCLTWANENWTRRWDGQENDVLIAQDHSDEDSLLFIKHLVKYFKDERYIKIDGKPILMVYRASIIPNMAATAKLWRDEVRKHGISDLYLICAQSFGIRSPDEFGFDASAEFPPHTVQSADIRGELNIINPEFNGYVFSYEQVVENAVRQMEPDYKLFRTAMLSWDNSARKQDHSHIFHGFSLLRYKQWLSHLCAQVYSNPKYAMDEKMVFVNAWNEWAEGTHLEPDRKFGYGYLQTTYDVLENYDRKHLALQHSRRLVRRNDYAVIVHAHYLEAVTSIMEYLRNLAPWGFDLYVTSSSADVLDVFVREYPHCIVRLVENRGRDILPFLGVLREIIDLGYSAVCKIHTKRSLYREDGDKIRTEQLAALLGSVESVNKIIGLFQSDKSLGLVVPGRYLLEHNDHNMTYDHEVVSELCQAIDLKFSYSVFPAGSMFWFRSEALASLLKLNATHFPLEAGLADGTPAHAVERVFSVVAKSNGYHTVGC